MIGDALAGGGGVYASDDDPELIRDALPFGLKTFESLLEAAPEHQGLLLAASRGFAAYAFLLQNDSDRLESTDPSRSRELRSRARNLYLRGHAYARRALELRHPGFGDALRRDGHTVLIATTPEDAPFLYWAGACLGGAISVAKNDLDLISDLPLSGALVRRVLEIDEEYDSGAAHEFFIAFEASRPGGSIQGARAHYQRALEISGGQRASVHLSLAENVTVREQNVAEFRSLLATVVSLRPETNHQFRLINTIARRRAEWLQSRIDDLFLDSASDKEKMQ